MFLLYLYVYIGFVLACSVGLHETQYGDPTWEFVLSMALTVPFWPLMIWTILGKPYVDQVASFGIIKYPGAKPYIDHNGIYRDYNDFGW